jgi:RNA polymerase sigma-70 factor, ECF subfamily
LEQELQHIIEGCKTYKAAQQEALYIYCYQQMFAVCERYTNNRDDAAAMYNEAMLKVLSNIEKYEYKGAFMGWVRRIMVNTCIDNCRKQTAYTVQEINEHYEEQMFVSSDIENKISSEGIVKLIQALPKSTSLVFNLYAVEGYKFDEVAIALNITVGTAKWHVSEARKTLKQKLQHYTNKATIVNG